MPYDHTLALRAAIVPRWIRGRMRGSIFREPVSITARFALSYAAEKQIWSLMFRFLSRFLGLIAVAGAFVGLIVDGARTIANAQLDYTPLGQILFQALPNHFPMLEPAITRHVHPFLWDPVLLSFLLAPAALVSLGIGLILMWLGRKPVEPIGYLAER